ncbi:MAG TPA: NADH-quinone oxidoreductase subunit J [Acidobacteriota bacterium]|nr:NADH-quinone oxidoreductase subunit J [Acidobacteriota bacterium]HQO18985.1 NADH-quinone oxidoreductase subunit J [Acidobacteriota bacterium]HQQ45878.1 NADH-quinone oxidoreductase subunit J [Acidobacteriota bacterium]
MAFFIAFVFFAVAAFVSSLFLIFHPKTIPASLGMVGVMVSLAGVFALLHFPFLSFIQVILYAGAVIVMAVYLVMSQGFEERGKEAAISQAFFSYALSVIFLFLYSKVILRSSFAPLEKAEESLGSLGELGRELITNYLVPFEILSVILVAAMVGAVVLSKRSAE